VPELYKLKKGKIFKVMRMKRRKTREVQIGSLKIGGSQPISVQSMAKTDTKDIARTVRQIKRLKSIGCEIVRVAVKDMPAAEAIGKIKKKINNIPLIADIHFHYRLALKVIAEGVNGIRLNPGNINKREEIEEIVKEAKKAHIPIRVGVNSGSLYSPQSAVHSPQRRQINGERSTADIMVNSALEYIKILEDLDFHDIIISLKASSTVATVEAYRRMAKLCDYPFHLGITATGPKERGKIKSAIVLGTLLLEGIGDTIRVSLTAPPEEEVRVGLEILTSLGLRSFGPEIISCPTCGRCEVDLVRIVRELEQKLSTCYFLVSTPPVKLAIMGCVVNGPGEAKDADVGIACGRGGGVLFRRGKIVSKIKEKDIVNTLLKEVESKETTEISKIKY
jgi:(E)-4-hydroxy-3-methylbut-2-enyl-diphosphate synthase